MEWKDDCADGDLIASMCRRPIDCLAAEEGDRSLTGISDLYFNRATLCMASRAAAVRYDSSESEMSWTWGHCPENEDEDIVISRSQARGKVTSLKIKASNTHYCLLLLIP